MGAMKNTEGTTGASIGYVIAYFSNSWLSSMIALDDRDDHPLAHILYIHQYVYIYTSSPSLNRSYNRPVNPVIILQVIENEHPFFCRHLALPPPTTSPSTRCSAGVYVFTRWNRSPFLPRTTQSISPEKYHEFLPRLLEVLPRTIDGTLGRGRQQTAMNNSCLDSDNWDNFYV